MNDIRMLIVDKDDSTRNQIKKLAEDLGYAFDAAGDGITAVKLFRRFDYQIIIMDTDLPMLDGWNVCRQIRKISDVPIIFVSSLTDEGDKLLAFELGADDFLCKPFSAPELTARIRVFVYRTQGTRQSAPSKIAFEGLVIDTISRDVFVDDRPVKLTPKEFDLLYYLSQNPNKAFSRDALLNEVWGYEFIGSDRTVDTHIRSLRDSIKPYDSYLVTVWGFGYKFVIQ
jgi:two-component system response regulator ResD